LTEAETLGRVKNIGSYSGYYGELKTKDPWADKAHDESLIKNGKKGSIKGRAPGIVRKIFGMLKISEYKEDESKYTAKQQLDVRKRKNKGS